MLSLGNLRGFTAASCPPCSSKKARSHIPQPQYTALQALSCRGCPCHVQLQLLQQGLHWEQMGEAVPEHLLGSFPKQAVLGQNPPGARKKILCQHFPRLNIHTCFLNEIGSNPESLGALCLCCAILKYWQQLNLLKQPCCAGAGGLT